MKKKPKFKMLRFRKNDTTHNLFAAAQHWIHANHGTAVVMGGVEVQQEPFGLEFRYKVAVNVTGQVPKKEAK